MGNAIGPDVSFYQDEPSTPEHIDFVKMEKSAEFVIIRAGQNLWADRDFQYNWAEAKKANLPRGSYWFYDSRADPKRQAELWVELMDGDYGELPLFADFEESYGGAYGGWSKWYDFLERLKELVGQKEISIYTAFYYWRDNAPNATSQPDELEYFHQYPLWIANYGATEPSVPKPWSHDEWLFWQFTEVGDGELYGVESRGIDLNYFNGDAAAFRERFNLDDPPVAGNKKYRVELNIRENPGEEENLVGSLSQDEEIEVLGTDESGHWMQIKREDDAAGWIYKTHLIEIETTEPPPPPPPPPPPEEKWYRVSATALNVREGPSTNYDKVGVLARDEVVKALDYAAANSWIKIYRESDGLIGWSYAGYLELTNEPGDGDDGDDGGDDDGDNGGDPPPTGENEWYRVTASALNVREGPSASNDKIGLLMNNEVVKALEKNADGSWIKIERPSDSLTGRCFDSYLELTDPPENDDGGDDPPAPEKFINWYQVKVTSLNVREGPSTSNEKVGALVQNEIVAAYETNEDSSWARIQRFDGLTGWSSTAYMNDLGTEAPEQLTQRLYSSVTYFRKEMNSTRKMVAHVLAIDTHADGVKCLVTPPGQHSGVMCTKKTTQFLEEHSLQLAINGDGFDYLDQEDFDPDHFCSDGGDPVKLRSYAASRGIVYSQRLDQRPIVYINKNNEVTYNSPKGNIYNAISGNRFLVEKGAASSGMDSQSVEPRTAVGTNQNGRWLFLVVVDGRQPGYSEGITFPELADFLISLGVYTGVNLDGGGSSTMTIENEMGGIFTLNSPIEGMIPGNEAEVANHLGFWAR